MKGQLVHFKSQRTKSWQSYYKQRERKGWWNIQNYKMKGLYVYLKSQNNRIVIFCKIYNKTTKKRLWNINNNQ